MRSIPRRLLLGSLFEFERRRERLVSPRVFLWRFARHAGVAGGIVLFSLSLGAMGYHLLGKLSWLDSVLNAAMILTGMGPVNPMVTNGGKVFAIFYSLFSGIVFLTVVAFIFPPVLHRLLHKFHLDMDDEESPTGRASLGPRARERNPAGQSREA